MSGCTCCHNNMYNIMMTACAAAHRATEPIRRVLNNCRIKVALKPFQTLGHIFAKPKDRVPTDQKHMLYTLYHAVIARKYIWIKQNASFAHV